MNYILDTNACIAVINGRPTTIRWRLEQAVHGESQVWVSSVGVFELWYGVAKSSRSKANAQRLALFLAGPIAVLAFDDEDARTAGMLRAGIEAEGRPIGAYDLLIASQALRRNMTLVTASVSEFRRIKGLSWENWAEQR